MGLFDMVMIKDNHISVARGVKDALNLNYSSIIYHEGTYQDAHQGSHITTRKSPCGESTEFRNILIYCLMLL
ncbi:hypothetical protein HYC85_025633 [Camellia sinensis]|uniref:Quinolinate phosphoribosyl transferase C-terminal domain-containing protein n=1 Tax=Camellia sinensis TaxID=4442 RepID=A0A7J7GC33_CAMSI|nr:hypothetical protein HYC85_025633 [Camellia sinensis]